MSSSRNHGSRERLAKYLAVAVAAAFIVLGVAVAVLPDTVIASSRYMVSHGGVYPAAALRIGIGVALLLVARGSRAPTVLRIMGVLLVITGFTFPILGVDSAKARIAWEAEHLMFFRMEGALFAWAGFIIAKVSKPRETAYSITPPNTSLERTREK